MTCSSYQQQQMHTCWHALPAHPPTHPPNLLRPTPAPPAEMVAQCGSLDRSVWILTLAFNSPCAGGAWRGFVLKVNWRPPAAECGADYYPIASLQAKVRGGWGAAAPAPAPAPGSCLLRRLVCCCRSVSRHTAETGSCPPPPGLLLPRDGHMSVSLSAPIAQWLRGCRSDCRGHAAECRM